MRAAATVRNNSQGLVSGRSRPPLARNGAPKTLSCACRHGQTCTRTPRGSNRMPLNRMGHRRRERGCAHSFNANRIPHALRLTRVRRIVQSETASIVVLLRDIDSNKTGPTGPDTMCREHTQSFALNEPLLRTQADCSQFVPDFCATKPHGHHMLLRARGGTAHAGGVRFDVVYVCQALSDPVAYQRSVRHWLRHRRRRRRRSNAGRMFSQPF